MLYLNAFRFPNLHQHAALKEGVRLLVPRPLSAEEAAAQAAAEAQAAATNGTEANGTEANGTAVSAVAATKGRGRDESDDDSDDVSSPLAPPLEPSLAFAPWLKWFGTTRSSQLSPWLAHGCLSPRKVWGLAAKPPPQNPSRSVTLHFKLL